jgi:predicted  nucleic acid-binding Zn-ribbon protein
VYAEEEDTSEHPGDHARPSEMSSDILNSPAFLKRKIDVLKSDIKKVESDLEEIKKQADAGKAEWGQQLDDLQTQYKQIQERLSVQNKDGDGAANVQVARRMLAVLTRQFRSCVWSGHGRDGLREGD